LEQTGLTASVGIACNKLLAKICCGVNKPNGLTYLGNTVEEILTFMKKQHVRKIPGIGKVNEAIMVGMGIETCADIITYATELYVNFSTNAFQFLLQSALGVSRVVHEA
jgi:DNA polymerase kappa